MFVKFKPPFMIILQGSSQGRLESLHYCIIFQKNWLAEWLSFIPVDPTRSLELEPMTTKCLLGGKGDKQERKVTQNPDKVEPDCP